GARRALVLLALAEAAGGLCEERRPAAELGGVRREAVAGVRADVEEKRELVPAGVGVLAVREVLDLQAADGRAARVGEVIEVVGVYAIHGGVLLRGHRSKTIRPVSASQPAKVRTWSSRR